MKTLIIKMLLSASCMIVFTTISYCQATSVPAQIEALLNKNVPGTKVYTSKVKNIIEIEEKPGNAVYNFKIPYSLVACNWTYSTKTGQETSYNANIKCTNNDACIIIAENEKERHSQAVVLSFTTQQDCTAFISLMDELKK